MRTGGAGDESIDQHFILSEDSGVIGVGHQGQTISHQGDSDKRVIVTDESSGNLKADPAQRVEPEAPSDFGNGLRESLLNQSAASSNITAMTPKTMTSRPHPSKEAIASSFLR
jgi:hypothetical protein